MTRRPDYVTSADEDREREVADILKSKLSVDEVRKNPRFFPMDLSLLRNGTVVCFAEVKSRNFESTEYPDVFLSVARAINMSNFASVTGLPVLLVWNFVDAMMGISIRKGLEAPWPIKMAGRTDRNDTDDIEPMFMVPVHKLKILQRKEEYA